MGLDSRLDPVEDHANGDDSLLRRGHVELSDLVVVGLDKALSDRPAEAFTVLLDETLLPKLARHRYQSYHVAHCGEGQVLVIKFLVFHGFKNEVKSALIPKHIHEVEELLGDAGVDSGNSVNALEAKRWLDHAVQLLIILLDGDLALGRGLVWHDLGTIDRDPFVVLFGPAIEDTPLVLAHLLTSTAVDAERDIGVLNEAAGGFFFHLGFENGGL